MCATARHKAGNRPPRPCAKVAADRRQGDEELKTKARTSRAERLSDQGLKEPSMSEAAPSTRTRAAPRRHLAGVAAVAVALCLLLARAAPTATLMPAPTVDAALRDERSQTAVIAGGCFWGIQAVFQHVEGVTRVLAGYSGGAKDTAAYEIVSTGRTGHAESVEIMFDPHQISYGRILQIYFSVAHDPTELNRQGPDAGTQYRSAIFYANDDQKRVAQSYIAQLTHAGVYPRPIVTKLSPLIAFYPAEAYHQDYAVLHPGNPYIATYDLPKLADLKRLFPNLYRELPVTVMAATNPNK
jgi:peptide-methionine (S)-S-oxide reductase